MSKVFVFGHKNPDTDTICSSIVYANLKQQLGMDAEAIRLGNVNEETKYALEYFEVEAPRLVEKVASEVKEVILVDHNEFQQSADDIRDVKILEVIDHHRIANFETSDPVYYRAEPVGCTATILYKIYKEKNVEITRQMAGLMLSAIVSDSLLFKSPTCTQEDKDVAIQLAEIAQIDLAIYGLAMLKAGADLSKKELPELLSLDAKDFQMGDYLVEVAQVNVVDVNDVLNRKIELVELLENRVKERNLDLYVFVLTDILKNDSIVIAIGQAQVAVEKAFNVSLFENEAKLKGVVSRKKQIIPPLTEVFLNS